MRLAGGEIRTVLITGVSRGLGKALALEMAKRGHCVIGCARSQDKLNALQPELASVTNPPSENKHLLMNVDVVILNFTFFSLPRPFCINVFASRIFPRSCICIP